MRIESFHSALYGAMDLPKQADTLSRMFTQLGGSLKSEITAIDIRDQRRDDRRQKWNTFAASVLSLIGVPVGFVLAFLGINASQVKSENSALDMRYRWMYFCAGAFALLVVGFILWPYVREWFQRRASRRDLGIGLPLLCVGGVAAWFALTYYRDGDDTFDLRDSALATGGGILLLVGFTMTVMAVIGLLRTWHERRRKRHGRGAP
jgi:hypothetical protein